MVNFQWVMLPLAGMLAVGPVSVRAQTSAAPAGSTQTGTPRQSGTIKAVTPQSFVLTTNAGQDLAVNLSTSARILLVDPATRDVKNAQVGTVADITAGDKAVVTGTAGDNGQTFTATRVLLLKSGAIAALHAQEQAAWAHSVGGIVKTTDSTGGVLTVVNGTHTYTVHTSPETTVRRYTGASVRFEDAVKSTVSAIQPGDQVQVRGQHAADSPLVNADEIVAGSFSNYSGLLTNVDPSAGTVTLKDLATKKVVIVAITPQTNLRKMTAEAPANGGVSGGAPPASTNTTGAPGTGAPRNPAQGESNSTGSGPGRTGGAGRMDLSRMLNHLPTESAADLKQGDAVMIVASNGADAERPVAITLLSGVERILASSPAGQTTLSPWSLGGGEEAGGESNNVGGR